MAEPRAASPLDGAPPIAHASLSALERAHLTKITVRGREATQELVQAVTAALDTAPPTTPNTSTRAGARAILWLAPGEWRVVAPPGDAAALMGALQTAVPRRLAGVVDVSDFYAVIRLTGAGARTVLTQGCPLDLHPRVFRAGQCAQSLLAGTGVLLDHPDAATFDIHVRWSYAAHLWAWLANAARGL